MTFSSDAVSGLTPAPPQPTTLGNHRIRLDFQYAPDGEAPQVPLATYHVCTALNIHFKDVTFHDHDDKHIALDDWPERETFHERFSVTLAEGRSKRHIYVGFTIRTSHSFSDIKNRTRQVLQNNNAWIYQHQFKFTQLDVVPLGFLYRTNTRFYSQNVVQAELREKLFATYMRGSDEFHDDFKDQYHEYLGDDDMLEVPGLMIVPANIRSGNEVSRAFEVHVAREDASMMKFLLEAAFSTMDMESTKPWFIPYSLRYDSADAFRSILRRQNEFLGGHRNIPIAGITSNQMHEDVMWNHRLQSPRDVLLNLPGIIRVETTPRTHDLGKFNIATTAETYVANVNWVDQFLLPLFQMTTETEKFDNGPFSVPTRMGSKGPPRMQQTSTTKKVSKYHNFLKSQFPTTVGTPPPSSPNAWQKPLRRQPVFNYDTQSFPPLPAKQVPLPNADPTTPTRMDNRPAAIVTPTNLANTNPTVSVSTTSTMTEVAAKNFIQECIQAEQVKLQETLQKEREQQKSDMQKFIQQAIAQTRESMQQPSTSLYVTESMLNSKFEQFKQEMLAALRLPSTPKRHSFPSAPQTPDQPHRETPVSSPVHKKTREHSPSQRMETDDTNDCTPTHSTRTDRTILSSPGSDYSYQNITTQPSTTDTALSQGRSAVSI